MEWIKVILESSEKIVNGQVIKPQRIIRGIAKIENDLYFLDYIMFSNFKWWAAMPVENEDVNIKEIENESFKLFYNSEKQLFYNENTLPSEIKNLTV